MQKRKIRRLSLHSNSIKSFAASAKVSRQQVSKVRSLDIFGRVTSIPPLSNFRVLRVLQVDDCSGLDNNHLKDLGMLHHLRFLRLHGLEIKELPESIGELESLETLDMRRRDRHTLWPRPMVLPVSLAKLRKLVRLLADVVELADGLTLENMTSLQVLVGIWVTLHAVTETGKLGELKVLGLYMPTASHSNANELTIKCVQLCPSLQIFILRAPLFHRYPVDLMAQLPSGLQTFTGTGGCYRKAFLKWNKAQLSYLTVLQLRLWDVRVLPEHLEQLAELPSLRFLTIHSALNPDQEQEKLSNASGFPCLTCLDLWAPKLFLKFQHGAMPKLQKLRLAFAPVSTNKEHFQTSIFDSGLENLPSLRHVIIELMGYCAEAEDAIRKAVNDHPNHPLLDFD